MRNKNHNKRINHNNGLQIAIMLLGVMGARVTHGTEEPGQSEMTPRGGGMQPTQEIETQPDFHSAAGSTSRSPSLVSAGSVPEKVQDGSTDEDKAIKVEDAGFQGRLANPGDGLGEPVNNHLRGGNNQLPQGIELPQERLVTHPASSRLLTQPLNIVKKSNDDNMPPPRGLRPIVSDTSTELRGAQDEPAGDGAEGARSTSPLDTSGSSGSQADIIYEDELANLEAQVMQDILKLLSPSPSTDTNHENLYEQAMLAVRTNETNLENEDYKSIYYEGLLLGLIGNDNLTKLESVWKTIQGNTDLSGVWKTIQDNTDLSECNDQVEGNLELGVKVYIKNQANFIDNGFKENIGMLSYFTDNDLTCLKRVSQSAMQGLIEQGLGETECKVLKSNIKFLESKKSAIELGLTNIIKYFEHFITFGKAIRDSLTIKVEQQKELAKLKSNQMQNLKHIQEIKEMYKNMQIVSQGVRIVDARTRQNLSQVKSTLLLEYIKTKTQESIINEFSGLPNQVINSNKTQLNELLFTLLQDLNNTKSKINTTQQLVNKSPNLTTNPIGEDVIAIVQNLIEAISQLKDIHIEDLGLRTAEFSKLEGTLPPKMDNKRS